jgi:transcriptional regulator with XRE-family HTH domain
MNIKLKIKIIEQFKTQADFAAEIGENESIVSRTIRGRRKLSAERQRAWADALHCDLEEIFGE